MKRKILVMQTVANQTRKNNSFHTTFHIGQGKWTLARWFLFSFSSSGEGLDLKPHTLPIDRHVFRRVYHVIPRTGNCQVEFWFSCTKCMSRLAKDFFFFFSGAARNLKLPRCLLNCCSTLRINLSPSLVREQNINQSRKHGLAKLVLQSNGNQILESNWTVWRICILILVC